MFRRRKRSASDFSSELQAHIDLETDRLRAEGLSEDEARARARKAFGNRTQYEERFYESKRVLWLDRLRQDLAYGLRQLRKNKGFTLVAAATLALGIGANTAIFSVMDATLFHPLPYPDPSRLVLVWGTQAGRSREIPFSGPNFLDFQDQNQVFADMGTFDGASFTLTGVSSPEHIHAGSASAGFFKALEVHPLIGRTFLTQEDQPGHGHVAVLGYSLWQSRFGANPNILGKTIRLDAQPYTVVGVLPRDFDFSIPGYYSSRQLWVPTVLTRDNSQRRDDHLNVIARLKPGVTLLEAQSATTALADHLAHEYAIIGRGKFTIGVLGHSNSGLMTGTKIQPLHSAVVGAIVPVLWILFAAAALVLLIACVNVANLQLVRVSARHREISIRAALGASRLRVMRQLLTESLLLAIMGGALGVVLASFGVQLFLDLKPAGLPNGTKVTIDLTVLAYCLGLSVFAGILFGIVPAFQRSLASPSEWIKAEARSPGKRHGAHRLRNLLMLSEVGLSVVLLIAAGLLIRSFVGLLQVHPGFRTSNVLTLRLNLPKYSYPDATQQGQFYAEVLQRIQVLPRVKGAAAINDIPLGGDRDSDSFSIQGTTPRNEKAGSTQDRLITPGYFKLMGIPLLEGRAFTPADTSGAPPVLMVSQSVAPRFFPHRNPIGQRIKFTFGNHPWATIVGVVGDVRDLGLDTQPDLDIYSPYRQSNLPYNPLPYMNLLVRTSGDPNSLASAVLETIRSVDKDLPLPHAESLESIYAASIAARRFNMLPVGFLAALALILAALGIYGVISYSVARRTQEIGIRIALGAERRDVLRLVIGQGMKFALIGLAIGIAGALGVTRFLSSFLYGVQPTDPLTFVFVALLLSGVAFLASYLPARRAAKVDPTIALRYE